MVWGCFATAGVGRLHLVEGTMDAAAYQAILAANLRASAISLGLPRASWIFQQDNDPKHAAASTRLWMRRNKIRQLVWPANSPDLNPIEHLPEVLERKRQSEPPVSSRQGLSDQLQRLCSQISNEEACRLVESMPRRLEAVIKAWGGPTKY